MNSYISKVLLFFSLFATVFLWNGCSDDPTSDNSGSGDTPTAKGPAFQEFYFKHANNHTILNGNIICDIAEDGTISNSSDIDTKILACRNIMLTPTFKVNNGNKVYVDNIEQVSGESSHNFTSPVFYKVADEKGNIAEYVVTLKFGTTGLPIVSIQTQGGRDITSKDNWLTATISIEGGEEFEDLEQMEVQVAGRGNSTWNYAKKPYKLKFGSKTEILGMPKHKRWVLLANYIDKTMLRNDVSFYLGKQTSLAWTPRGYHVELILNGEHKGNYYLCEQIKIDKNRVTLTEQNYLGTFTEILVDYPGTFSEYDAIVEIRIVSVTSVDGYGKIAPVRAVAVCSRSQFGISCETSVNEVYIHVFWSFLCL